MRNKIGLGIVTGVIIIIVLVLIVGYFKMGWSEEPVLEEKTTDIEEVKTRYESSLLHIPGVVGVGISKCYGELCIKVLLERETEESESIPKELEGFKVVTEVVGVIEASPPKVSFPVVSIREGEDWSLPSWVKGWSPYGGIYMLWYGWQVPVDNPNVDIRNTKSFSWKQVHIGSNQFDWSAVDNDIAKVAAAGKKFIFYYVGARGEVSAVPQWVIDKYPNTPIYQYWEFMGPVKGYKLWVSGMGEELKNFVEAFANRYKNDARVAYAYYVAEPVAIFFSGVGQSEYEPFYEDLLKTWVTYFGSEKVIETGGRGGVERNLDELAIYLKANIRSGAGEDLVQEFLDFPWLNQRYDKHTGYVRAFKQPTPFYGTENEVVGLPYEYRKIAHLATLAMGFNYHLFHTVMYLVERDKNWTDPKTGITYDGSKFAPLRDYIRYVQGYPPDKAPDAYAVLREMTQDLSWSERTIVKNMERFLYQRDGFPGGKTKPGEERVWNNLIDARTGYLIDIYNAKDNIGYEARLTDKATGNNYIYFGLDDAFMYGGTNNVAIKVYYKDVGSATWRIEYEAADGNRYKPTPSVTNTNSGTRRTATFTINDAKFANGQGYADGIDINQDGDYLDRGEKDGLDFRIYNGGSEDIIVGMVRVLRL